MKIKFIGILICFLLISSILSISGTVAQNTITKVENIDKISFISNKKETGITGQYKSLNNIPSPDGKSYRCIMFCYNHKQTLDWISLINESGFEKAWKNKLMELTILLFLPGTLIYFASDDFRSWYLDLFLRLRNKDDFLDFLSNYDQINGNGMITYLWLKTSIKRPVDFKSQPDNSWIEESWILDDGKYIPNSEIWSELFFWYFDLPPHS